MLWFRNAIWYRFIPDENFNEAKLLESLTQRPFVPCRGAEPRSVGWGEIAPDVIDLPLLTSHGFHLIAMREEEKILPSSVIKDQLAEKVAEIESAEDRKVYRKEKIQLKDELTLTLLPRAFTRRKTTRALIAPHQKLLVVEGTSYKRAEELLATLREDLGTLGVKLIATAMPVNRVMSDWLLEERDLPSYLELGAHTELKDPLEPTSQIKIKGQNLTDQEIQAHLSGGMLSEKLELVWRDQLSFTLEADLRLKALKMTDTYQEQQNDRESEDQALALDADLALLGIEFTRLIPDLINAFGGEAEEA